MKAEGASKQDTHCEIDLACHTAGVINWERVQASEFRGKQQIGAWPVNQVAERAAIAAQNGAKVVGVRREASNVTGEGIFFGQDAVQFKLGCELEFELAPSSGRVQSTNAAMRIRGIAAINNG